MKDDQRSFIVHALSSAGVAVNTSLFAINLFADRVDWALFNLLFACLCWVGVLNNKRGDADGN